MQYGIEQIMPLTKQNHYTVGYHDNQLQHYEICEYAMSAITLKQGIEKKVMSEIPECYGVIQVL